MIHFTVTQFSLDGYRLKLIDLTSQGIIHSESLCMQPLLLLLSLLAVFNFLSFYSLALKEPLAFVFLVMLWIQFDA